MYMYFLLGVRVVAVAGGINRRRGAIDSTASTASGFQRDRVRVSKLPSVCASTHVRACVSMW